MLLSLLGIRRVCRDRDACLVAVERVTRKVESLTGETIAPMTPAVNPPATRRRTVANVAVVSAVPLATALTAR